jgi:hypothetical protein
MMAKKRILDTVYETANGLHKAGAMHTYDSSFGGGHLDTGGLLIMNPPL